MRKLRLTRLSHLPKCGGLQKQTQLSIHHRVCHIAVTWWRDSAALPTKSEICSPTHWPRGQLEPEEWGGMMAAPKSIGPKRPAMFLLVLLEPWHDCLHKALAGLLQSERWVDQSPVPAVAQPQGRAQPRSAKPLPTCSWAWDTGVRLGEARTTSHRTADSREKEQ